MDFTLIKEATAVGLPLRARNLLNPGSYTNPGPGLPSQGRSSVLLLLKIPKAHNGHQRRGSTLAVALPTAKLEGKGPSQAEQEWHPRPSDSSSLAGSHSSGSVLACEWLR